MRKLAALTLLSALCLSTPAVGQESTKPVVAPEFAESFPALLPMNASDSNPTSSPGLHPDEPALIAAMYWALIGGLALRRAMRRRPDQSAPVSSRNLGRALPVPARVT